MRALLTAALAAALISSVSACQFSYNHKTVKCDDGGKNCAYVTSASHEDGEKENEGENEHKATPKPTVAPTIAPTPAPTATPLTCSAPLVLDPTGKICVAVTTGASGA